MALARILAPGVAATATAAGARRVRRTAARAALSPPTAGVGAERPSWLPGTPHPEHLKGELPGDYGFDPLSLGSDPEVLSWFVQAELQHARWAMVGFLGITVAEVLTLQGQINAPLWFNAGEGQYFTDGWTLFGIQFLLMGWAEARRWMDIINPGSVNQDPLFTNSDYKCTGTEVGYPGGNWFDPLGITSDAELFKKLQLKEIQNGRLAMIAMVGCSAQASATKAGHIQNWLDHIADPSHTTLFQTLYK